MEPTLILIVIGTLGTVNRELVQGLRNKKTSENHPNDSIIKIGQNTEKSPGDLRTLPVIQTPMKIHRLTLV